MSIMKSISAFRYARKITGIRDTISRDLDEYQDILEKRGFTVRRSERMVRYEAARSLIAEKGNVILRVTRFLRGGKDLSVTLRHGGHETTVPLYFDKFDEALASADAAQYLIR